MQVPVGVLYVCVWRSEQEIVKLFGSAGESRWGRRKRERENKRSIWRASESAKKEKGEREKTRNRFRVQEREEEGSV